MRITDTKSLLSVLFMAFALISVTACNSKEENGNKENRPGFTINGTIENAEGRVLYFANESLGGTIMLDSAKIGKDGKFEFKQQKPETYEFYIVGFEKGIPVVIAVDSTETITLTANANDLAGSCKIEGSPESEKIKELSDLIKALEKQIAGMEPDATYLSRKAALIDEFKANIAKQYIIASPDKASAYFALWLTSKGEAIFKPLSNRTDSKCFAAVATSMKRLFSKSQRTEHLCNIAEQGMKNTRPLNADQIARFESMANTATTDNLFNITLPDRYGNKQSLSSLKGKVVLLDFTLFEDTKIKLRNVDLRELHDRYSKKGLEIFQVSIDRREHFWQQEVLGLPWTCVHDSRGTSSPYLATFNVLSIPTFYLINKDGEIVMRDAQIENLEKEIEKLIK